MATAPQALADFAQPPEPSPYRPDEPYRPEETPHYRRADPERWSEPPWSPTSSTVRFHVGPAVLIEPSGPGLFTALDIGQRAVGARLSGSWLRAESDQGLSAYTAELWIDFRHRYELHPILGAGASWLRGGAVGEDDNAGVGVLRGALEYELPISDADARLGLNLSALVPAIGTERTRPWATAALTVGAGF
ncbi:MAG TPA: hypothetical protein VJN18_26045 [Polyangiaceae bacterium]|nr:hypothetical protein [Polyangiaceae bacterium]